jgi:secreted PhoX family phosphatase
LQDCIGTVVEASAIGHATINSLTSAASKLELFKLQTPRILEVAMTLNDTPALSRRDPNYVDPESVGIDRPGLTANTLGGRPHNEPFRSILAQNLARRTFLKGAAAVPVLLAGVGAPSPVRAEALARGGLGFTPIAPSTVDDVLVPPDYSYELLLRWGDPLFPGAPQFHPHRQSAAAQRLQFGYNCDFVGYFALEDNRRALLCVNHEYTTGGDMFRNHVPGAKQEEADIEIAAHGGTVVEIERDWSGWRYLRNSRFNRRITGDSPLKITGPAAGHRLLKTQSDRTGRNVLGMLNNCSGGKTPWGTWLTCEENFNQYFANNGLLPDNETRAAHTRYGIPAGASGRRWETFYPRFDCNQEPNEPFRFGWVIEIDPYDPDFVPRKRTALGRCKHEAAATILARSGQVVIYSGDDERFDYVYKYISKGIFNPGNRKDNFDLLDEGSLFVAKFNADGTGEWLELTIKNPVLAAAFADQGEVLIKTRLAADLLGATPMDRPEDLQPNPVNGKVYLTMTNNSARTAIHPDPGSAAANPRVPNFNGHIIELTERGDDYAAKRFTWDIFLLCGNPDINLLTDPGDIVPGLAPNATFYAGFADANKLGRIASPDNISFDSRGNLWIATDGQPFSADLGNVNDALHVVPTQGPNRGHLRQFASGPRGCEVCGVEFSPDERSAFCAIQHPGEDGGFPNATSNWPDRGIIPRPSVIAIRHSDGRTIGT